METENGYEIMEKTKEKTSPLVDDLSDQVGQMRDRIEDLEDELNEAKRHTVEWKVKCEQMLESRKDFEREAQVKSEKVLVEQQKSTRIERERANRAEAGKDAILEALACVVEALK